jgi:hypothetical protein
MFLAKKGNRLIVTRKSSALTFQTRAKCAKGFLPLSFAGKTRGNVVFFLTYLYAIAIHKRRERERATEEVFTLYLFLNSIVISPH